MSKNKVAFGTVIGIAAGVVAGLLLAPKAGRNTRADLKAKAKELKQKAAAVKLAKKAAKAKGKVR